MRNTRRKTLLVLALLVATFGLSPALGSDVIIYPAKGQARSSKIATATSAIAGRFSRAGLIRQSRRRICHLRGVHPAVETLDSGAITQLEYEARGKKILERE